MCQHFESQLEQAERTHGADQLSQANLYEGIFAMLSRLVCNDKRKRWGTHSLIPHLFHKREDRRETYN